MTNNTIYLEELPYRRDVCELFDRIRDLPAALLLDSGNPHTQGGRFDIMMAAPLQNLSFTCSNSTTYEDIANWFADLLKVHSNYCSGLVAPGGDIPFCGGIAGYMDYGVGKALQRLAAEPGASTQVYLYGWALIQDHLLQRSTFAALPALPEQQRRAALDRLREPHTTSALQGRRGDFQLAGGFTSNLDRDSYRAAFRQIQHYIRAGDCYQVNLAQRFSAAYRGDPWQAYCRLRPIAAAPFSGYLECAPDRQLLSLSPERFLRLSGRHVETSPIKGTRPRHTDPVADELAAQELRVSPKDRAENLMIVDLLRNDIGRDCVPGSIQVDRLFVLESYPTVHHLVSTISGELLPGRSATDLLRDCFPGGSITGAPKRRAMQIIEELEPDSRRAYCGSLFYISADGRMDSNIAIRSLLCDEGRIHCWGGGGIVADSEWEQEYQETWDKVGRFIEALEHP